MDLRQEMQRKALGLLNSTLDHLTQINEQLAPLTSEAAGNARKLFASLKLGELLPALTELGLAQKGEALLGRVGGLSDAVRIEALLKQIATLQEALGGVQIREQLLASGKKLGDAAGAQLKDNIGPLYDTLAPMTRDELDKLKTQLATLESKLREVLAGLGNR